MPSSERSFLKTHRNEDNFQRLSPPSGLFSAPPPPPLHFPPPTSSSDPTLTHPPPQFLSNPPPPITNHPLPSTNPNPPLPDPDLQRFSPREPVPSRVVIPPGQQPTISSSNQLLRQVIILRGIPGSGKSHYARSLGITFRVPRTTGKIDLLRIPAVVCSADDYFIDPRTGQYRFDRQRLGDAHRSCRAAFLDAVRAQEPLVVVDNTNSARWEYQQYFDLAQAYGYEVKIVEFAVSAETVWKCHARNRHQLRFFDVLI
jgi:hypothetical protein